MAKKNLGEQLERVFEENGSHSFLVIAFPRIPVKSYRIWEKGDIKEIAKAAEAYVRRCLEGGAK